MSRQRLLMVLVGLIIVIFGCTPLESKTSYQGQLTDSSGNPVTDGNYQITFRLYDEDDATVGDALWTETQNVPVEDGLFHVTLGATQPIETELFSQKLWLGVEVESDGEMTPRQQLTGAPYAMSLVAGAAVQGSIDQDDPLPGTLNVANYGDGFGLAVNSVGEAGLAVDGAFTGVPTGQHGLLIDNVLQGAVITSTNGTAVWANGSGGATEDNYGLRAESQNGDGVFGWGLGSNPLDTGVTGRSENGYGVYSFSINGSWGFYTDDDLYVGGSCTGCTMRYIVVNDSGVTMRPGDTVSAAGVEFVEGMTTPIMEVAPTAAGQNVLGVVVGAVETFMVEEGVDDLQPGLHFGQVGGDAATGEYLIVVVQGLAQVRAADLNIQSGDLVYPTAARGVSAEAAGHAIGLALDSVDTDGLVWVLVGFE